MGIQIAIDGNEANVKSRVGSNVYAFELLHELRALVAKSGDQVTVLLAHPPSSDLPSEHKHWRYKILQPRRFWTQWALPLHLYLHSHAYDVLFTPGHYAPRLSPIPYVTAVLDTAYLDYPDQFTLRDRVQLTKWTEYSVKHAAAVITISEYTKQNVVDLYHVSPNKIKVAYPAADPRNYQLNQRETKQILDKFGIQKPYILFVGTLQPRKNLITLIEAFEMYNRRIASLTLANRQSKRRRPNIQSPTLVLAGKVGWKASPILERIHASAFKSQIILTGFVSDIEKAALYKHAMCQVLLGIHEGFGIPPLEAMQAGTLPVVARAASLPEVVGEAGYLVDPHQVTAIAEVFFKIAHLSSRRRAQLIRKGLKQAQKFSWHTSAQVILNTLRSAANPKQ